MTANILLGSFLSAASFSCRGRSSACKDWITHRSVWYTFFVLFSFTVLLVAGGGSRRLADQLDLEELLGEDQNDVSDNNTLLWLYAGAMRDDPERFYSNFVLSPFSIMGVFRTLEAGANGETLEQMKRFFNEEQEQIIPPALEEPAVFRSAERVYVNSDGSDRQLAAYRERVEQFGSEVRLFNFPTREAAVVEINDFVEEVTEGMVDEIISVEDLPEKPDLTAVSGAILKAQWLHHFVHEERRVFHAITSHHQHVVQENITFMTQSFKVGEIRYAHLSKRGKIIRLPFGDKRLGMYIILPDDYDHLAAEPLRINNRLDDYFVVPQFSEPEDPNKEVIVTIPKFDISPSSSKINVVNVLQHVGITRLSEGADFSRLSDRGMNLNVDVWLHEAGIHTDENGVCVGAEVSTTVGNEPGSLETPLEFLADHPFFFAIVFEPSEGADKEEVLEQDYCVLLNGHLVDAAAAQTPEHD